MSFIPGFFARVAHAEDDFRKELACLGGLPLPGSDQDHAGNFEYQGRKAFQATSNGSAYFVQEDGNPRRAYLIQNDGATVFEIPATLKTFGRHKRTGSAKDREMNYVFTNGQYFRMVVTKDGRESNAGYVSFNEGTHLITNVMDPKNLNDFQKYTFAPNDDDFGDDRYAFAQSIQDLKGEPADSRAHQAIDAAILHRVADTHFAYDAQVEDNGLNEAQRRDLSKQYETYLEPCKSVPAARKAVANEICAIDKLYDRLLRQIAG